MNRTTPVFRATLLSFVLSSPLLWVAHLSFHSIQFFRFPLSQSLTHQVSPLTARLRLNHMPASLCACASAQPSTVWSPCVGGYSLSPHSY